MKIRLDARDLEGFSTKLVDSMPEEVEVEERPTKSIERKATQSNIVEVLQGAARSGGPRSCAKGYGRTICAPPRSTNGDSNTIGRRYAVVAPEPSATALLGLSLALVALARARSADTSWSLRLRTTRR